MQCPFTSGNLGHVLSLGFPIFQKAFSALGHLPGYLPIWAQKAPATCLEGTISRDAGLCVGRDGICPGTSSAWDTFAPRAFSHSLWTAEEGSTGPCNLWQTENLRSQMVCLISHRALSPALQDPQDQHPEGPAAPRGISVPIKEATTCP